MATSITNGYTDLSTYKQRFYAGEVDDHQDDSFLNLVITSTSRAIDEICQKRFFAVTETRYYTRYLSTMVNVDDLLSVTTLKTDDNGDRTYNITWDTDDYDLMPYNAALNDEPYTFIETAPATNYYFPATRKGIEIAGSFGYSSTTPALIQEACLLGTHRYIKRGQTPLGVSAAGDVGQLRVIVPSLKADPDIMGLLSTFVPRL